MNDEPLHTDPATGEPVRRIITGGFGVMKSGTASAPTTRGGSCGPSCGCH